MLVPVVENLKSVFRDANRVDSEQLAGIYHKDIVFIDPVHKLEGFDNLCAYMDRIYSNVTSSRFEYTDELLLNGRGSVRWNMTLEHPKLNGGSEIVLKGASFIEYDELITHQEDYYDLGAMLYEHIAVIGTAVRYVKRRLG